MFQQSPNHPIGINSRLLKLPTQVLQCAACTERVKGSTPAQSSTLFANNSGHQSPRVQAPQRPGTRVQTTGQLVKQRIKTSPFGSRNRKHGHLSASSTAAHSSHRAKFTHQLIDPRPVCLVDPKHIRSLQEPGLHGLNYITRLWNQQHHNLISDPHNLQLGLANTYRLNNHAIKASSST
tara:strand:+ start:238 stop:774 length:537 start_codon:yes stop_codon:yes gene_type:complete